MNRRLETRRCLRSSRGFTLMEIMVVVFVLGLLASLATVRLMSTHGKAKVRAAETQVAGLSQAVQMFALENGRLPDAGEGLAALIPPPPADLPNYDPDGYLDKAAVPLDPWGRPFEYRRDGRKFAIISYGEDGVPGREGVDSDIDSRYL